MDQALAMAQRKLFRPSAKVERSTVTHAANFDAVSELSNCISLDWFLDYLFSMRSGWSLTDALFVIDLNQARAMRCAFWRAHL